MDEHKSAEIPSANHSLIVCEFPLMSLDGLACLGCVFGYVPSKATWLVSLLLTPLLRWFQQGSRETPVRSLSFSANEAADGRVVWTVVVLSSIKFINSRWRSCCCAMC